MLLYLNHIIVQGPYLTPHSLPSPSNKHAIDKFQVIWGAVGGAKWALSSFDFLKDFKPGVSALVRHTSGSNTTRCNRRAFSSRLILLLVCNENRSAKLPKG